MCVAVGEVVEDGDAGHVVERLGPLRAQRALADDEHQLGLVVEPHDPLRPRNARLVANEAGIQLHERGGLLRHLGEQLVRAQLFQVLAIVLAYAQELIGVRDRGQVADGALFQHRPGCLAGSLEGGRTAGEQLLHAAGSEIDDLAAFTRPEPESGAVICTKGDEAHGDSKAAIAPGKGLAHSASHVLGRML